MTAAVEVGCYVFGIVPAGAQVPAADPSGPAAELGLVAAEDIAALVGRVPVNRPLGRAADLRAHDRVLADVVASGTPVLPMRFGAVVTDEAAVVNELLAPNRARFREALEALAGRVQYTVKVRYEEEQAVREVVAANPEIARLRSQSNDPATQIRLGELVVRGLEQMRPNDASAILAEIVGIADVRVREPSAPDDVLDAAFLVDSDTAAEFEQRVEEVAKRRAGRMRVRLVGPSAAYDFVGDE